MINIIGIDEIGFNRLKTGGSSVFGTGLIASFDFLTGSLNTANTAAYFVEVQADIGAGFATLPADSIKTNVAYWNSTNIVNMYNGSTALTPFATASIPNGQQAHLNVAFATPVALVGIRAVGYYDARVHERVEFRVNYENGGTVVVRPPSDLAGVPGDLAASWGTAIL